MKKILIVEDQMLARKYLCSCIEKSTECEVASALTRADAALQRCGEGHIDLVVMDICTCLLYTSALVWSTLSFGISGHP